jgi:hypothetical protein
VLRPGGRILIADAMKPKNFFMKRLFKLLAQHHGLKFDVEDSPATLKSAGFTQAIQLNEHFAVIGFVLATKPNL